MDKTTAKELDRVLSEIKNQSEKSGEHRVHISFDSFANLNLRFPIFEYVTTLINKGLIRKDNPDSSTPKGFYSVKLDGQTFEGFQKIRFKEMFSRKTKFYSAIFLFIWSALFTISDRINDGKKETLEFENKIYKKKLLLIPQVINEINSRNKIKGKPNQK
jgi:hypothetical protein